MLALWGLHSGHATSRSLHQRHNSDILDAMQSLVTRSGRLLFALLATWCLGCSSFEMFASALTSDRNMVACTDAAGSQNEQHRGVSVSPTDQASVMHQGCGCDHCVGTEIVVARVSTVQRMLPASFDQIARFPARISREPAVPPPELLIAG